VHVCDEDRTFPPMLYCSSGFCQGVERLVRGLPIQFEKMEQPANTREQSGPVLVLAPISGVRQQENTCAIALLASTGLPAALKHGGVVELGG